MRFRRVMMNELHFFSVQVGMKKWKVKTVRSIYIPFCASKGSSFLYGVVPSFANRIHPAAPSAAPLAL